MATLCTGRLLLRRASRDDLPALLALWREPEVNRYLFDGDAPTALQAARLLDESPVWMIERAGDRTLLGAVSLRSAAGSALQPGIALHLAHRRRGYAQEALAALLPLAGSETGATRWVASCCVPDSAGARLLRRLGFVATYECDGGRYRVRQYRRDPAPRAAVSSCERPGLPERAAA